MLLKFVICVLLYFELSLAQEILVTIPNGQIRGRMEYSMRKTGVPFYAFQQIPYGKAPVGNLRFNEPQPAEPWEGILDATNNTKVCYQVTNGFNIPNLETVQTEDCLFVNVYTPQYPNPKNALPVMVWIYGGGFINGVANFDQAGPHYFMENNVMIVTINYRVGPFGFLATDDLASPGNYGLKDQNLALRWIRDNIKYFGGDPDKITIFGTSAGAASVSYHFMSKKSDGLFWAGISTSGSILVPWAYQKDHKQIAYKIATYINSSFDQNSSTQELVQYLRSLPADTVNEAAAKCVLDTFGQEEIVQGFFYAPVMEPEHENAFITERMYAAIEEGRMNRVPLMIGIDSEEALTRAQDSNWITYIQYYDQDSKLLINNNMGISDENIRAEVGQKIKEIFTDGSFLDKLYSAIRYFSDMSFNRPIIRHAELQSQYSDVYFYEFSYSGQLGGTNKQFVDGAEKVQHSEDGNYYWTFGNWTVLDNFPPEDVLTSERWRLLLTNFAKYRNPTPEPNEILENIIWPKLVSGSFQYLNINKTLTIVSDYPKSDTYHKWVELYETYAVKPYINF
ncbi:venom carboxylesterase-6-like [Diorhabda carinulata]|uniref:venom carboxylesterase-6-like n=1 Tax=Diorhabda carinulata TaxID=1163345 RepID=UPI0025A18153|nr:venom carboxylesterase-6-like [Diorhabda carinulata]